MSGERHLKTVLGLAVLGGALAVGAATKSPAPAQRAESARVVVRLARVDEISEQRSVRFSGIIRAKRRAMLSFSVPARLAQRPVDVGDRVRVGEALGLLDDRGFSNAAGTTRAAVAELAVRVAQAERDRIRVEHLVEVKAATSEELEHIAAAADAVKAAYDSASAQLAEAERVQGEAVLRAPFAGTVTAVMLQAGEWAAPGMPVVELSGDGDLELHVEVPESVVPAVREGLDVVAELPFASQIHLSGRIASVSRAAAGPGRLFPVVVDLAGTAGVAAGMTAELLLPTKTAPDLVVPLHAVVNPGSSRPAVFVVTGDRARRVEVEVGQIVGERVAVRGDLRVGDRVVIAGHTQLADGDQVEVRQ